MDLKLRGKRALVTGSTAGIGFSTALGLAREGAEVVVNGRTGAKVGEAIKRIAGETDAAVTGIAADLGSAEGVDHLLSELGHVDILVNNLGIFEPKPFLDIPDTDWFRFFETNVMSGVRLSRALLPHMIERDWGRIIFISSESGLNIPAEMVHYGMTKTAQLAISRGLAESVAGTGVTVNAVLPGPTRSEGAVVFLEGIAKERDIDVGEIETEVIKTLRPSSLIRRMASPDEVANLVVYLCGEGASATTGAALRVDGGVVRTIT
jgi:NAD(P)-dependent dehydrogenase (short-subunit alcohol dehydrogenase family)